MALIIEDGTGRPDAQSWADAAEAREYAAIRGVALPPPPTSGQDQVETYLVLAKDFIDAMEPKAKGRRSTAAQALSWPRSGVRIACGSDLLPSDVIPANLVAAQLQLVVYQAQGFVLNPVFDPSKRLVKRKKVDVLETEYFGPSEMGANFDITAAPSFPIVDALLKPLYRVGYGTTAPAYRA